MESRPTEHVKLNLEFIEPFAFTAIHDFTVKPDGAGSTVEWAMAGNHNFMSKTMCLVMGGMDKMIGPDLEKGLAQMKSVMEK